MHACGRVDPCMCVCVCVHTVYTGANAPNTQKTEDEATSWLPHGFPRGGRGAEGKRGREKVEAPAN